MTRTEQAEDRRAARDRRAREWERRLAVPVIVAAAVSIPAVFLATLEPRPLRLAGHGLNWASLAVLAGETVLLLALSGHRWAWLWRHRWRIALTLVAVPAVTFAVFPAQALRLLRLAHLVGTLRVLRARTILRAGRTLARRLGLTGPWRYVPLVGASGIAAGFVVLVLSDPTAVRRHQAVLAQVAGWRGTVPVLLAGGTLIVAGFVVLRLHRRRYSRSAPDPAGSEPDPPEPR
ncbi:MAG TPA: hypothetical protein VKZ74_02365 [Natronosporangium sp.]|nr:hypothetical protein [Natronosporangium sp.]